MNSDEDFEEYEEVLEGEDGEVKDEGETSNPSRRNAKNEASPFSA